MSRCQGLALLGVAVIGAWPVASWSQIDEIVVTTRKKEESLQDVPIAVNAITDEQIQRQGVSDLNDIVRYTPSVQFDRSFGPSDTRITLRGLSNSRGRSNVAFLVDNIDVTTENLIVAGSGLLANRRLLTDVERIEIVKGPQSALYGRAAFAGAFNYITKEPGDEFEGMTKVDFAEDGFQQVDAAFGGPLTDTLGLRATGFWYNQGGHYVNSISGEDVGGSSGSGAALTGVWRPNAVVKLKVRGEYSKEDYDPLPNIRIGGGWQDAEGVQLFRYPNGVLQHAINQVNNPDITVANRLNGLGFAGRVTSTGLLDFGQYCPERLKDGTDPGLCLPTTFGSADGRAVTHSENPLTGEDFDGTDLETFRLSAIATFDLEGGLVTSYTGWTNFDAHDNYDQDWQADLDYKYTPFGGAPIVTFPDTPGYASGRRADQLISGQIANTESGVDQFSQELRFASKLDGPINYTVGVLYWDESRTLQDKNAIMACLPLTKTGLWESPDILPVIGYQAGLCDGAAVLDSPDAGPLNQDPSTIGWQQRYRDVQPQPAAPWRADTRHWSFYGTLTWEITDQWSIDFEERFVSESFHLEKPNQSTCTNLADNLTTGQAFWAEEVGRYDALCVYNKLLFSPEELPPGNTVGGTDTVRLLEGSTSSHFDTPKITLNWKPTPDNLVYFYWAEAQKPGGINQLTGGGSATFLTNELFLPEKLTVWELGTKNTLDVRGPLQANVSLFFNDYSDKQVNTQVVVDGVSQPRVLNASSAEVWGAEFEFLWEPDFLEGLRLNLAYTYLDAEYKEFTDDVTSLQRLAYLGAKGDCQTIYKDDSDQLIDLVALDAIGPGTPEQDYAALFRPFGTAPPAGYPVNYQRAASVACHADLSGNKLERTPENAVAMGVSYTHPLVDTGLDLLAEVNAAWQDERYLDQDNGLTWDSYWTVDARLGLVHPKYEIIAYVDNLLDDDTIRSGGSGPDFARQVSELGFTAGLGVSHFFGTLPDPRIFGVRATYRFGAK